MVLLKDKREIEKIRTASRYAMEILLDLIDAIEDGIRSIDLEGLCEGQIRKIDKIRPAFKGYNGFPYCLCISVNDEVVHGMPDKRVLKKGDVVSLDFGVIYDGYYGDVAYTKGIGSLSSEVERLISVTEEALYKGIEEARPGNRLYDISSAIQTHVEAAGLSVVREFVGHGIGKNLHEEPQVPNVGKRGMGMRLKSGMVFAIEPMVTLGGHEIMIKDNGWTAITKDGSLSAHFEHTVAITDNGPEIFSRV
jgi:methionyl aminopeptidase